MISGFDIVKYLPEDSKYFRFELKPMKVDLMVRDLYGCTDYNKVELHSLLVTFSFKTYKKFWIGPQVCEPTYKISVIYSMNYNNSVVGSHVSGMELDDFIKNLKQKEQFNEVLKEAFEKAKDVKEVDNLKKVIAKRKA